MKSIIKKGLNELDKNQSWLAGQLGVTRQAVSYYAHGRIIPEVETLNKLLSVLNSGENRKIKTLEKLIG